MANYQNLILIGFLMLIIGIFLIFFGAYNNSDRTNTKLAVGGFIGFIPFGFWSDESSKKVLMLIMSIIVAIFIFIWLKTRMIS